MKDLFKDLSSTERRIFKKLNTPQKIQDYLETIPINFGETLMSPRNLIVKRRAHCVEGALFAAAALLFNKQKALILDLQTTPNDDSHVVTLFRRGKKWGAISKTNHAVLRYRDPIYDNPRQIAFSYFHEYFLNNGKKTLRSYAVFDLAKIKKNWVTDTNDLTYIDKAMDRVKHINFLEDKELKILRKADPIERQAGKLKRWKK